jgi:hypothetical protein
MIILRARVRNAAWHGLRAEDGDVRGDDVHRVFALPAF